MEKGFKAYETETNIFVETKKGIFLLWPENGADYEDQTKLGLPSDATEINYDVSPDIVADVVEQIKKHELA